MGRDPPTPSSWLSSGPTSTVRSQTRVTHSMGSHPREYLEFRDPLTIPDLESLLSVCQNNQLAPPASKFHQEFAEKINISIELGAGYGGDHLVDPSRGVTS